MARRGRDSAVYELVLTRRQLRLALVVVALSIAGAFVVGGVLGIRWVRARALAAQDAALSVRQTVHELTQPEEEAAEEPSAAELAIDELIPAVDPDPDVPIHRAVLDAAEAVAEVAPATREEPEDDLAPPDEDEGTEVVPPFSLEADRSNRMARGVGSWVVQVLATPSELEAKQLSDKLALAGFPTFVSVTRDRDRTLFRVRVGTFGAKTDAERAATELRRTHRLDTWIFQ